MRDDYGKEALRTEENAGNKIRATFQEMSHAKTRSNNCLQQMK